MKTKALQEGFPQGNYKKGFLKGKTFTNKINKIL
jgi:hypothetical protein